jgi:adenylate cyclase
MKTKSGAFVRDSWSQIRQNWWGVLVGGLLSVGAGILMLNNPAGQPLVRLSYDAFFPIRGILPTTNVVLLYVDEDSYKVLEQPYGRPWDRSIHAELLNRLTAEGAKAVVFDIVFGDTADPNDLRAIKQDEEFADAIEKSGKVVLAADLVYNESQKSWRTDPPCDLFYNAAKGNLGLTSFYADPDLTVRQYLLTKGKKGGQPPSEAWQAAEMIGATITKETPPGDFAFYMNYYGPGSMPGYSYYRALNRPLKDAYLDRLPDGTFKDKVVFVGAKYKTKIYEQRKDEYQTPFSSLPTLELYEQFVAGVEIHANAYLNLANGDWITGFNQTTRSRIILLAGVLFGCGLILCRPGPSLILALGSIAAIIVACYFMFKIQHYWFPWTVVAIAQIPVALLWSVGVNSIRLYVEKRLLEQSLAAYVSPKRVKQIVGRREILKPGAEKQMLTVLFSDIENFTVLSEGVDSDDLAKLMNRYFENAVTNCIFKTDGTVVKYIGDAIFSFWNAPEEQQDHQIRACEAALLLSSEAITFEKGGQQKRFRTRVGLHTGVANVGNFGSAARIDYTALGENINLASRMEGLNKYLGTSVLITGDTHSGIGEKLILRFCGKFILKGFEKAVEVYEIVCKPEDADASKAWREAFSAALKDFCKREFDAAERGFRCVLQLKPDDGPSKYYLKEIEEFRAHPLEADWDGEIELKEK